MEGIMDVTALFDDADAAEHALVSLQSLGIFPSRYKIKALHIPSGNASPYPISAVNFPAGGFYGISAADNREPPSREVQLLLTVDETAAERAKSALISSYGRRVRILTL
jgi:hypothetical protein